MVFQGEDTPLTEDVLRKPPPKFIQTRHENVPDEHIQITEGLGGNLTAATRVLFTVPKGRVFYLTSSAILISALANPVGTTFVRLIGGRHETFHIVDYSLSVDNSFIDRVNYAAPLFFDEGDVITVQNASIVVLTGSIVGWTEAKRVG